MRNKTFTAIIASLLFGLPALAQPGTANLDGTLRGTVSNPAAGQVEVVSSGGHQYIKFDDKFSVRSQTETEVRHVDGATGKVTVIGPLVSREGYQVYEVPERVTVGSDDKIVLYNPLYANDLADVDLTVDP